MPAADELAPKKYPRSAALRATFVRGVEAAKAGASDYDNPYTGPCVGFRAANRNAWREGWAAWYRKEVTHV